MGSGPGSGLMVGGGVLTVYDLVLTFPLIKRTVRPTVSIRGASGSCPAPSHSGILTFPNTSKTKGCAANNTKNTMCAIASLTSSNSRKALH